MSGHIQLLGSPLLDPVVAEVGDEYLSVSRDGHGHRVLKRARAAPPAPDAGEESAVGGEFLDPVIVKIGDEDVSLGPNSKAGHGREPALEGAEDIEGERPDLKICRIDFPKTFCFRSTGLGHLMYGILKKFNS